MSPEVEVTLIELSDACASTLRVVELSVTVAGMV
jgi:hypothetical protein